MHYIHVHSVSFKTGLIICNGQLDSNFMRHLKVIPPSAFNESHVFNPTKYIPAPPLRNTINIYYQDTYNVMLLSENIFHHYLLHTRTVAGFAFQNEGRTIKIHCITTSTSIPSFHVKSNQNVIRKYSRKLKMILYRLT